MKEFTVKISEENIDLALQLLVKSGAEIKEKLSENISPTYLFGKW